MSRTEEPSEYKEGFECGYSGNNTYGNPYPWTNAEWWRNQAWSEGYEDGVRQRVEDEWLDDDYD